MRISTFFYTIKQGIKNIWKNKLFSLASIATMTACIFLFGLFYTIVTNFQSMVKDAESGVAVTVLFNDGISQEQIDQIGQLIGAREEVDHYDYISADEAWNSFKEGYFAGNESVAESFGGDNPLVNSSSYAIYLKDVSMQQSLVDYLQTIDGVRSVKQSELVANTLTDFNKLIGYISAGIIVILLGVAVFLISNTITVGISVRREEIGIMKLIGAANGFIKAPFQAEGMIIGILGSLIPTAIIFAGYEGIINWMNDKFHVVTVFMKFVPIQQIMLYLLPLALLVGIVIGLLGSSITIRKYLKV